MFVGLTAIVALTATLLVLPVYAAPAPEPEPVTTSSDLVDLGSVEEPAPAADVQAGTTDPVAGVTATAPTLTVTRTGVDPFSLVGVTWAYDPAVTDTVVQVRVLEAGGGWGAWTEVSTETADQGTTTRTGAELRGGTSPLWTGRSTGVELELVTRSGAQPTDVQLDLVDPGTSEADTALGVPDITDTAHAATTMPAVYSRAQWGADESIRTWAPQYAATIKAATLHHTADTNNYTAADVPAMMRSIYRYHTVSLGWGDIGYNVIVDKFGRMFEGRYGGLASTVIGAHAGGFNTSTFGVSMLGNYDVVGVPQATVDAVSAIIAWKFSLFGMNPQGTTVLTSSGGGTSRYAAGTKVTLPTIFGHRDVGSTACPGQYGYSRLAEIRDRVTSLMGTDTPQITARYDSDVTLRAALGAKTGIEATAAGVSWQPYVGGNLYYSPATGVVYVHGAVLSRYLAAGGPASLGAPNAEERGLPDGRGVRADFEQGAVYWTAATGAHVVRGALLAYWASTGAETGPLGYPVVSEISADRVGAVSRFENGTVYWSPTTGARTVRGGVAAAYEVAGAETGVLGYPVSEETTVAGNRGRVQQFTSGSVYWTPAFGALVVRGGVGATWASLGGPTGVLGFPTSIEWTAPDGKGRVQLFEGGSVYWTAATGAHGIWGGIRSTWVAAGAEAGPAGYPTSEEAPTGQGAGIVQQFQSGQVYWLPETGARMVRGAVGSQWLASGGVSGRLGYPTSDEQDVPGRAARVQLFRGGAVYWSAATAAHIVRGDIATAYEAAGGVGGVMGLPVTEAVATADGVGRVQSFQGGPVYWSAAGGAHVVRGAIGSAWLAGGGPTGRLGYPTSSETGTSAGVVQEFQGGSVTWPTTTYSTAVSPR
ncbi:N-acetylmuramoyl-L-alanine amidase [Modestobacter sp. DSM 44400]|uniref:N-acetylmuramoyl-L-alanine amidase n=1 Tax=Modestobacter sp. DSM 44400 TaxID=1550230 RepID=UPI0020C93236|nr:N-acetylmuramoyl-L-alanine amidase [Modestobacter sp. DSM 44400]